MYEGLIFKASGLICKASSAICCANALGETETFFFTAHRGRTLVYASAVEENKNVILYIFQESMYQVKNRYKTDITQYQVPLNQR